MWFINYFSPEPPSAMFRLDAATLSAPPSPGSTPNSAFSLELHGLLLDDLHLPTSDLPFLCSSISNLPQGVGVALTDTISVKYDHQIKVGGVSFCGSRFCLFVCLLVCLLCVMCILIRMGKLWQAR